VEAAGHGIHSGLSAATTQLGKPGVLHGSKSLVMQTEDGQVVEPHSISAGLDILVLVHCMRIYMIAVVQNF
jgi:tryptophan synthase beta chain